MFRNTLLLATAGVFYAFLYSLVPTASAALNEFGSIRSRIQDATDVDAQHGKNKTTETGWVFAKIISLSCEEVCLNATGAAVNCNLAALISVDTAAKLEYVVEKELNLPAGAYVAAAAALHPSELAGTYSYNPATSTTKAECAKASNQSKRICCCNSDAQFCPTAKPGLFEGKW